MSEESVELPAGWVWTTLPDVAYFAGRIGWKGLTAKEYTHEGAMLLSTYNLNHGNEVDFQNVNFVSMERYDESPEIMVRENDVLLTKDGAGIGKLGIVKELKAKATINSSLLLLRAYSILDPSYLFFSLGGPRLQRIVQERITGSTTPHLFQRDIKTFKLPLPPLNEQRRIVAKIEALQARSRAAKAALDAIPPMLERFRQSVLASAFRGDLTKAWREQNPDVEPASVLLERIRAERRTKWIADEAEKIRARAETNALKKGKAWGEAENAKALETGMQKATAKYTAPEPVDATDLPELPAGWVWSNLDEVSRYVTSGSRSWSPYYSDHGALFIRTQDINTNTLRWHESAYVDLPDHIEGKRSLVEQGDILITITGANVGKVALVEVQIPEAYVSQSVALVKLSTLISNKKFIQMACLVPGQNGQTLLQTSAYGIGRPVLNLSQVKENNIVFPPLNEQKQIVAKIEQYFDLISNIEAQIEQARARLATLDQAILAKAFRGELVPQDPNDEPASVLLERIRAERERLEAEKKAAKKSASKSKKAGTNRRRKSTKKVAPKTDTIQTTKAPIIGADGQIKLDFDTKERE